MIVCGHSNGLLELFISTIESDNKFKTVHKTLEYDSFISTVKFFYHNHKPIPSKKINWSIDWKFSSLLRWTTAFTSHKCTWTCCYLSVLEKKKKTKRIIREFCCRNILEKDLTDPIVLWGTDAQDCVTSSCICDIDLDGKNEILLGTFGKICYICRIPIDNYSQTKSQGLQFISEMFPVCEVLSISASAYGLTSYDLTHDQLDEVLLATTKGLHIYQLDLNEVEKLIKNRVENALENVTNGQ